MTSATHLNSSTIESPWSFESTTTTTTMTLALGSATSTTTTRKVPRRQVSAGPFVTRVRRSSASHRRRLRRRTQSRADTRRPYCHLCLCSLTLLLYLTSAHGTSSRAIARLPREQCQIFRSSDRRDHQRKPGLAITKSNESRNNKLARITVRPQQ